MANICIKMCATHMHTHKRKLMGFTAVLSVSWAWSYKELGLLLL
jgi:hypothetical protein